MLVLMRRIGRTRSSITRPVKRVKRFRDQSFLEPLVLNASRCHGQVYHHRACWPKDWKHCFVEVGPDIYVSLVCALTLGFGYRRRGPQCVRVPIPLIVETARVVVHWGSVFELELRRRHQGKLVRLIALLRV